MSLSENQYASEFLQTEAPGKISRENVTVTVAASTTLVPGQVLGKISASGKYVPYDDTASDGRETAAGILYSEAVNAALSPADVDGVIINGIAEVRGADLEWGAADVPTGTADLAALFIKVRS